jgi:hypothetical protein
MPNVPAVAPVPPTNAASPSSKPAKIGNGGPTNGIIITVAVLQPGAINTIVADPNFVGRAVLMPPGTVVGVDPDQYSFVAYVCPCMGPLALYVPNVSGILFADLPNGILPPTGSNGTIFDAISAAIKAQVSPTAPDGTGNGH